MTKTAEERIFLVMALAKEAWDRSKTLMQYWEYGEFMERARAVATGREAGTNASSWTTDG